MSYRTSLRSLVIGACTAALVAGSGLLTLPAQAEPHATPAASAARATRAELTVGEFWQQYRDATRAEHSEGKDTVVVRQEFLSATLDAALTDWGAEHQLDPIFRSQEIPTYAKIATADEDAGHEKVVLTESFADGTTKKQWYQVNTSSMLIDGLTDAPPTA
ncbi:hypothetical protein ACFCXT_14725 [Streptomyces vinaceus]|uniref:hypothetical protein n=1 Tax=Streptomyces vinaceus TaxID=1960 RepID=UPI0035DAEB42